MSANDLLLVLMGMAIGGWLMHLATWAQARKVEDLVPGGLRAWDNYERANAQAKGVLPDNVHHMRQSQR